MKYLRKTGTTGCYSVQYRSKSCTKDWHGFRFIGSFDIYLNGATGCRQCRVFSKITQKETVTVGGNTTTLWERSIERDRDDGTDTITWATEPINYGIDCSPDCTGTTATLITNSWPMGTPTTPCGNGMAPGPLLQICGSLYGDTFYGDATAKQDWLDAVRDNTHPIECACETYYTSTPTASESSGVITITYTRNELYCAASGTDVSFVYTIKYENEYTLDDLRDDASACGTWGNWAEAIELDVNGDIDPGPTAENIPWSTATVICPDDSCYDDGGSMTLQQVDICTTNVQMCINTAEIVIGDDDILRDCYTVPDPEVGCDYACDCLTMTAPHPTWDGEGCEWLEYYMFADVICACAPVTPP